MVKITKGTTGVYPDIGTPDPNFIQEIKHIRQYTHDRYGICSSLQTAKAMIEDIMNEQKSSPLFAIDSLAKDMDKWQVIAAIESLQNELRDRYKS